MDVSLCRQADKNLTGQESLPDFARKRHGTHGPSGREAHPCARRKRGSLTLEAAVIAPLLAAIFAFFLFFFRVLQVQTQVQESLYYASRLTACEAATVDSETALLGLAEVNFQTAISQYDEVSSYVKGGNVTLSLFSSDVSDDYVKLQANYEMTIPVPFFSLGSISVTQASESRKWTGDSSDGSDTDSDEEYVYVTETGKAYHKSRDCSYLTLSIQSVEYSTVSSLRNKDGCIYYPCSCASGVTSGTVYITDYGTEYHADMTCSALKRTVSIIPISEVGSRTPCSKCAK